MKKITHLFMLVSFLIFCSGCGLISTALSAGIAYGIYQATRK